MLFILWMHVRMMIHVTTLIGFMHIKIEVITIILSAINFNFSWSIWCFEKFGNFMKKFRSNGGGEFTSTKLKRHLEQCGTLHQFTCPYTPQQAGKVERCHRSIVEIGLTQLFHSRLPPLIWNVSFQTSMYLNRFLHFFARQAIPIWVFTQDVSSLFCLQGFRMLFLSMCSTLSTT